MKDSQRVMQKSVEQEPKAPKEIPLSTAIEIANGKSNPAEHICLQRGILYATYNGNTAVQDAVDKLPDDQKVFFPGGRSEKMLNPWATMDRLGVGFLKNLPGGKDLQVNRKGILDNALQLVATLRVASDIVLRSLENPATSPLQPHPSDLENAKKRLLEAGLSTTRLEKAELLRPFKEDVDTANAELLKNYKAE